jgi:ABC-2 type transport system permease protein
MSMITESARRARPSQQAPARPTAFRSNLNLTRELAITSFKLKYTGSVLGYAWSLVKPLLIFGVTYVVFAVVLLKNRTTAAENFPVQLLLGIVVWTFFAESTGSAVGAIVGNGHIIRKAYFPRWIVVVSATVSATMTLFVNLSLVLVVGVPLGWFHVGASALIVPLLFVEMYTLVVGIGLLLSALFVFYRDLGHVWEIALQLLFYASAIVFPLSLAGHLEKFVLFNPMAQIIEDLRRALVTPAIPWSSDLLGSRVIVPCVLTCVILGIGYLVFRKLSPRFGEAL